MLGKAAVAMWYDVSPALQAEFEEWHTYEHMPERLSIPGFLRGTRWIRLSGEPSYFVLYEAEDLAAITSGPYLERLNDPTPWSRKMMPHHLNMVRSPCVVRSTYGAGLAYAMATLRLSPRDGAPELPRRKGVTGAHLLQSQAAPGTPTTEQKIRGADGTIDRVLLAGGYDAQAVEQAVSERNIAGATLGVYRVAFSLVC